MSKYATIGILGGMGPESTAELYRQIIQLYQLEKGAVNDADFPAILINSLPAEDMLNNLEQRKPTITKQLTEAVRVLENAGADFIAVPCNTATIFMDKVRAKVSIPIIDLLDITAQSIVADGYKKVGILASTSTIKSSLYEKTLAQYGVSTLSPDDANQPQVNDCIINILAGRKELKDKTLLEKLAVDLTGQGAEAVVLGCTELPLLIQAIPEVRLVNTISVLARKTFTMANQLQSGKEKIS